jgi:hypothetical protein
VCDGNEDLLSALLNEELDIDSEDDVNFEILSECGSEDSRDEVSETESESDISDVRADGWESVTVRYKKPKSYTFTKNAGPQFNLLPDADPICYFSLFFNDELLNNIVIETGTRDTKFWNFSFAQGPFGIAGPMCLFLK